MRPGRGEAAIEEDLDVERPVPGDRLPPDATRLALPEPEAQSILCLAQSLDSSRLAADVTEHVNQLKEAPVLIEHCDVALARTEDIVDIPVEREPGPYFCKRK